MKAYVSFFICSDLSILYLYCGKPDTNLLSGASVTVRVLLPVVTKLLFSMFSNTVKTSLRLPANFRWYYFVICCAVLGSSDVHSLLHTFVQI